MTPLVYIVIPVYNREKTIEKSVQSVLNQTFDNWTLILVDDNSTDNSFQILKKKALSDNRIKAKKNLEYDQGPAGARMSGLVDNYGDYIAFLDSDDEWPEYHLEKFVDILENNISIDFIFGDIQRIDQSNQIISHSKFLNEHGLPRDIHIDWNEGYGIINDNNLFLKSISSRFNTGFHTAVFRSSFFNQHKIRNIRIGEDFIFTLEAVKSNATIAVSKEIHLFYLVHDNNISSTNKNEGIEKKILNCLDEIRLFEFYIPKLFNLSTKEKLAVRKKLSEIYVWILGNSIYKYNKLYYKALCAISKGIVNYPLKLSYWKTLLSTLLVMLVSRN